MINQELADQDMADQNIHKRRHAVKSNYHFRPTKNQTIDNMF